MNESIKSSVEPDPKLLLGCFPGAIINLLTRVDV